MLACAVRRPVLRAFLSAFQDNSSCFMLDIGAHVCEHLQGVRTPAAAIDTRIFKQNLQAAHGWLEQEALGDADDGQMDDNVKLAFPEWVSSFELLANNCCVLGVIVVFYPSLHLCCCLSECRSTTRHGRARATCTTWCSTSRSSSTVRAHAVQLGKSLCTQLADTDERPAGRMWPEEDKGEVELLLMLISHICGAHSK